ncbi:hypothetical protein [Pseudomonas synxantha]|nr:hypothetical protein [Pseudomonas synxantha]
MAQRLLIARARTGVGPGAEGQVIAWKEMLVILIVSTTRIESFLPRIRFPRAVSGV